MKGKRDYACVNVHDNTGGGRDVCVGGGVKILKHGVLQSKCATSKCASI